MPLDVIMPALGMAQDTGLIVAWHKNPGDQVEKGDVLFEVETDKATMEVEAAGAGFLTDVTAAAGTDVPVGDVIARISETAEGSGTSPAPASAEASASDAADDLPQGNQVIMPTLGMAQDTGLIVSWQKEPGDAVAADDVLFEVETDKSTVEVPAGFDGFFAAKLASAGEDIPVGQVIAIISADKPAAPVVRSAADSAAAPAPAAAPAKQQEAAPATKAAPKAAAAKAPATKATQSIQAENGRILASPKLRRLALEQGLDLNRLVKAGYPQPYHARDLETLRALPDETAQNGSGAASRRITAEVPQDGFDQFLSWAATQGFNDQSQILASLVAASMAASTTIAVEAFGNEKIFASNGALSGTQATEEPASLRLRDLRFSPVTDVEIDGEDIPALTLTKTVNGLKVTLEFGAGQMPVPEAVTLISNFAGRIENPLRHLL